MAPRAPDHEARNLGTRIASAAVLAPAAIVATWSGSPWFDLMVLVASGALSWEWARVCGYGHFGGIRDWLLIASVILPVGLAVSGVQSAFSIGLLLMLACTWLLAGIVMKAEASGWRVAGILLVGVSCILLIAMRGLGTAGLHAVIWILLVTWSADTGGYFVGRLVGGPRLAPRISPKKTWSGMIGGLFAAIVVGGAYAYGIAAMTVAGAVIAALVVGSAAVLGDLLESAAKRRFRLKDSSALIPGHGGLLDRVDGLLLAVPAAALVLSETSL